MITTTITTINDAKRLISSWTERYDEQLTDEQMDYVARRLVEFIGGYGNQYRGDDDDGPVFDLIQAINDAEAEGIR